MNITQVKVFEMNKDKLKAFATITISNEIVITGLKIMDSINGYWVAMPSRKNSKENDGSEDYKAYIDTVYPITKEARNELQTAVLTKYREFMESNEFSSPEAKTVYNETHSDIPSIDVSESDLPF